MAEHNSAVLKIIKLPDDCVIYHTLFFCIFCEIALVNKEEKRYNAEIASFGKRIKEIRKGKKLTQLDLELSAGIDRAEISRIENGLRNIEFFSIVKLAIALDVNLSEFFPA